MSHKNYARLIWVNACSLGDSLIGNILSYSFRSSLIDWDYMFTPYAGGVGGLIGDFMGGSLIGNYNFYSTWAVQLWTKCLGLMGCSLIGDC